MAIERPAEGHREFQRRFNARDVEGLVALYEEGAKLVLPQGEVMGRDAIREAYGEFLGLNGKIRIETVGVVEGNGVALLSANWRMEGEGGNVLVQGESVEIWRKGEEGWLTAVDCPFGVG